MKSSAFANNSAAGDLCRRFLRDERGTPAVEFGILAPVFFMLLFSVMQISVAYFKGSTVQWAVDRAVRVAMINPAATSDDVREAVRSDLSAIGTPDFTFSYTVEAVEGVQLGHATATYSVPVDLPMFPEFSVPFTVDTYVPVPPGET